MKLVPLLLKEIMCVSTFVLLLFSCVNKPKVENISPLKMKLTSFLDTFYLQHSKCIANDIRRQDDGRALFLDCLSFLKDDPGFVSELPMKFEGLLEYEKGDSCLVKFSYSYYWLCNNLEKYEASKDYQTSFQLYSIIGREQASYLIDNNLYFISGVPQYHVQDLILPSGKLLPITYPKITESVIHDKQPDFDLGILIVDSLSFKLAK